MRPSVSLTVLPATFAICRLDGDAMIPEWALGDSTFVTITRTADELSIVVDACLVPSHISAQPGYRALRMHGPIPLHVVGVMACLAVPLADAGIAIFPIATHDTDYILVHETAVNAAISALTSAGHHVDAAP